MAKATPPPLTLPDPAAVRGQIDSLERSGELALLVKLREKYAEVLALHEAAIKRTIEKAAHEALSDADFETEDLAYFASEHRVVSLTEPLQLFPLADYLGGVKPEHPFSYCLKASLKGLDDGERRVFMGKLSALRSRHSRVCVQVVEKRKNAYVIFFFKIDQTEG